MKTLKSWVVVLVLGFSVASAQASVGPESSWQEIKTATGYVVGFPVISFGTIGVSIDGVCIDGDNLRPFNPERSVCVEWDYTERNEWCTKYETVTLSTSRTYTAERCAKWDARGERCLVTETYTGVYPSSYNVSVYKLTARGEYRDAFSKQFDIPACN
ncbi:MAG: hypothetical protein A2X94_10740 [Bdellovibrionales bacterium GWB1_55_8]|nr:MAG: hypothetical protein A2X94_10740 [Bdellovibrionales bacterium GWB1_55_8]